MLARLTAEQLGRCLLAATNEDLITTEALGRAVRSGSVEHLSDEELGEMLRFAYCEDLIDGSEILDRGADVDASALAETLSVDLECDDPHADTTRRPDLIEQLRRA
jgi:hypothetical protein